LKQQSELPEIKPPNRSQSVKNALTLRLFLLVDNAIAWINALEYLGAELVTAARSPR
jgi:hypothetical protein